MSNVDLGSLLTNSNFINVRMEDTEANRQKNWNSIFVPEIARYYEANWPDSMKHMYLTLPRGNGKNILQMRLILDTIHKLSKLPPRIFLRRINLTHEEKLFFYQVLGVKREYLEDENLY